MQSLYQPEYQYMQKKQLKKKYLIYQNLSKFEKQVLDRYVQGESYVDIAQEIGSPVKSIDNAILEII